MNVTSRILGEATPDYNQAIDAYFHAKDVVKGQWPEGEEAIASDPEFAFYYAKNILRGRFPKAEPLISEDPYWAYNYAVSVVDDRWPKGEAIIAQNPKVAYAYARDVIIGRWPEAEETISKSEWKEDYLRRFPEAREEWAINGWIDWLDT